MTTRMLTGIQPSGELHLGNYFGAVQPCLQHQEDSSVDLLVFLADFHALTTVHDGERLRSHSEMLAKDLIALGLDHRTTLFRQSHLPEVTELALLLSMGTGMGLLQRAHSYKDKVDNGITPTVGLFFYPVLMAADILIHRSDLVPVGRDQIQHIEMARDMATRFNEEFGHTFELPEALVSDAPNVPGIDGRKMSKSYDNTISPFDEGDDLRAKVAAIKTRTVPFGEPLPTEDCAVLTLLELLGDEETRDHYTTGRRGSSPFGYGHAKQVLAQKIENTFAGARERRRALTDKDVEEALATGAWKASDVARDTLDGEGGGARVLVVGRRTPRLRDSPKTHLRSALHAGRRAHSRLRHTP